MELDCGNATANTSWAHSFLANLTPSFIPGRASLEISEKLKNMKVCVRKRAGAELEFIRRKERTKVDWKYNDRQIVQRGPM